MGVTTNTYRNIIRGKTTPRPENVTALENTLGWAPGQFQDLQNGSTTVDTKPTPPPSEQLRVVGGVDTEHGLLTWTELPGGLRDYTLSREIAGVQRGASLPGSSLSPAEVVKDLAVGLKMLEKYYELEG